MITGIHHVALKCSNADKFEEEIKFYTEILGLPVKRSWATGIMLDTGMGLIEIFNDANDVLPQGAIRHFALASDNVDEAVERVRAAGYKVTTEPKDIVIPSEIPFPARIAFVEGPLNEEIEFFCEK